MTLDELAISGAEITIARYKFNRSPMLWSCTIKQETKDVKLEVQAYGVTHREAINGALAKWHATAKNVPEFSAPVLEHKTNDFGDETPF